MRRYVNFFICVLIVYTSARVDLLLACKVKGSMIPKESTLKSYLGKKSLN